jgi:hypothetical protein
VNSESDIGDEHEVRTHEFGVASYPWDLGPVLSTAAKSSIILFVRGDPLALWEGAARFGDLIKSGGWTRSI